MSKILLIGHSVLDRIYYKSKLQEKPGGIFHTANTLVSIANSGDEVYLITHTSKKSYKYFSEIYDKVRLEFSETKSEIPTVTLNLYDYKERDEKYSRGTEKINLSAKIDYTQFDIILVNMISGFDITHEDLKMLKEKSSCEIYFDIHTLSRGIDVKGNRVFRIIPEIEKWLNSIDVLQMNESEAKTLWGINSESENINKLLEVGVEKVIITKGKNGVTLYNKGVKQHFKAIKTDSINFVGCGDSFGAAFCYHYSKNKELNSAVDFANLVAGIITSYNSQNKFKKLKTYIKKYD